MYTLETLLYPFGFLASTKITTLRTHGEPSASFHEPPSAFSSSSAFFTATISDFTARFDQKISAHPISSRQPLGTEAGYRWLEVKYASSQTRKIRGIVLLHSPDHRGILVQKFPLPPLLFPSGSVGCKNFLPPSRPFFRRAVPGQTPPPESGKLPLLHLSRLETSRLGCGTFLPLSKRGGGKERDRLGSFSFCSYFFVLSPGGGFQAELEGHPNFYSFVACIFEFAKEKNFQRACKRPRDTSV